MSTSCIIVRELPGPAHLNLSWTRAARGIRFLPAMCKQAAIENESSTVKIRYVNQLVRQGAKGLLGAKS